MISWCANDKPAIGDAWLRINGAEQVNQDELYPDRHGREVLGGSADRQCVDRALARGLNGAGIKKLGVFETK